MYLDITGPLKQPLLAIKQSIFHGNWDGVHPNGSLRVEWSFRALATLFPVGGYVFWFKCFTTDSLASAEEIIKIYSRSELDKFIQAIQFQRRRHHMHSENSIF